MPFWTEHTFQPKRVNRFEIKIRPIDSVNGCEDNQKFGKEIEWSNVVSAQKPSFTTGLSKFKYLNTEVRFANPPTWNPIKIVILDIVDSDILQSLKDSQNEYMYRKEDYRLLSAPVDKLAGGNQIEIYHLDENGQRIEKWTLERAFFTNISYSQLDYSQDALSTIEITIEYDDAHLTNLRSALTTVTSDTQTRQQVSRQEFENVIRRNIQRENYRVVESECPDNLENCTIPKYVPPPKEPPAATTKPSTPPGPDNITASADVLFAFDSSVIKDDYKDKLDEIAKRLIETDEKLLIEGHTDKIGSDEYNQQLSERRANAVRDYLIQQGVPEEQLTAVGRGEEQANQNANRQQRAADRNVQFEFSEPEPRLEEQNTKIGSGVPFVPSEPSVDTSMSKEAIVEDLLGSSRNPLEGIPKISDSLNSVELTAPSPEPESLEPRNMNANSNVPTAVPFTPSDPVVSLPSAPVTVESVPEQPAPSARQIETPTEIVVPSELQSQENNSSATNIPAKNETESNIPVAGEPSYSTTTNEFGTKTTKITASGFSSETTTIDPSDTKRIEEFEKKLNSFFDEE